MNMIKFASELSDIQVNERIMETLKNVSYIKFQSKEKVKDDLF